MYSKEQIKTLKELRKRFFELHFDVHSVLSRYRKHPLEFVVVEKEKSGDSLPEKRWTMNSAIARLYRGGIRITFLEVSNPLTREAENKILSISKKVGMTKITIARGYRNGIESRFKPRYWHEFVYKRELKEHGIGKARQQFRNAGITIKNLG